MCKCKQKRPGYQMTYYNKKDLEKSLKAKFLTQTYEKISHAT